LKSFTISIAWLMLVFWCAIRVGFALQTIEPAVALITDQTICQAAGAPVVDGHCRAEGRVEGGLDDQWHLHTPSTPAEGVTLPRTVALLYSVDSYQFRGGAVAGYALAILAFILAALPALASALSISRKVRISAV